MDGVKRIRQRGTGGYVCKVWTWAIGLKLSFPYLLEGATYVEFGGEVYYKRPGSHTSTQMGSGHFAEEGFTKSSFFKNVQILDGSYVYQNPGHVLAQVEAKKCYDLKVGRKTEGSGMVVKALYIHHSTINL
ncbi:hypothetical protein Taro_002312 [Colocasia esculenta]|uniref:Neprosin PEP catalytic domain-containing protein n=1 Tax=Colocasia esculenta TaxID=4460 RepID=A0A843TG47_COLES|nr:hypothetical protein [Colocasia esculenta]